MPVHVHTSHPNAAPSTGERGSALSRARGRFSVVGWLAFNTAAFLSAAGLMLFAVWCCGCVDASLLSRKTTTTKPDGTVVVEQSRQVHYADWTSAAQGFASFLGDVDWKAVLSGPVLGALGVAGTGGIGAVGLFAKYFASHHQSKGRRQERAAAKGLPTP